MGRDITAAQEAETLKQVLQPFLLAEFEFSGGTQRFWTGGGDLPWNGNTYTGTGLMGRVSGINETLELRASGVVFELNGLDPALLATALTEDYQGRTCRAYLGTFQPDGAITADPTLIYAGRMDVMGDEDDGRTGSIQLTAENHLVDLRRTRSWRNTDQDQKQLYPGDRGFEFVAALQDKEFVWG